MVKQGMLSDQESYQDVITFWFEEIDKAKWFAKDTSFDQLLRDKFAELHGKAVACELSGWRDNALGSLAEVIILDQFSRNIFRDEPQAFLYDPLSLALAQVAIAKGFDKALTVEQTSFLYMPFMHSESLVIHNQAVKLFTELGAPNNLEFELKHKAIIEQFGRYPHRNEILGRYSTPQELEYLAQPGAGF
ncbi:membrane protein [Thalassotalea insulae]|uniref:Membrane protein n=1 Tax=Thalassotalea insulae TaxID=2056778 RepID=A0ABQ6GW59_9GAMM|nr:DUF924 family protein [Thalassotalea insulae]GLX80097.1 membrane protein [Thalassotalea insulae]